MKCLFPLAASLAFHQVLPNPKVHLVHLVGLPIAQKGPEVLERGRWVVGLVRTHL